MNNILKAYLTPNSVLKIGTIDQIFGATDIWSERNVR